MTLVWLDCFKVKVKSLSCVRLFATPWTVAHQAPPSMGFSRQEYWSGFPFPSPGHLPNPGIEPRSPALQVDALTSEHQLKVFSVCSIIETLYNLDSHKMKQPTKIVIVRKQLLTVFSHLVSLVNIREKWLLCRLIWVGFLKYRLMY